MDALAGSYPATSKAGVGGLLYPRAPPPDFFQWAAADRGLEMDDIASETLEPE